MKNIYEVPELEISLFLTADVMTESDNWVDDPWGDVVQNNLSL